MNFNFQSSIFNLQLERNRLQNYINPASAWGEKRVKRGVQTRHYPYNDLKTPHKRIGTSLATIEEGAYR